MKVATAFYVARNSAGMYVGNDSWSPELRNAFRFDTEEQAWKTLEALIRKITSSYYRHADRPNSPEPIWRTKIRNFASITTEDLQLDGFNIQFIDLGDIQRQIISYQRA